MHKKEHQNTRTPDYPAIRGRRGFGLAFTVAMFPAMLYPISASAENHKEGKPPVTIEASRSLEWNQTDGTYIAKGDAYIVQGESNIKAEHIIARYKPNSKTRELTRVIAIGSVLYKNAGNSAHGEKLDYDLNAGTYVLTGKNARATGPEGEMTANQSITYDEHDINKQIITAVGKARYKNIDGRTLYGDRLVAVLGANGALVSIDGFGNTKVITTDGTTAIADKLNYVADTSLAKLDGNVVINDKANVMRGGRAEIDFKKDISRILSDGKSKRVSGVLTP